MRPPTTSMCAMNILLPYYLLFLILSFVIVAIAATTLRNSIYFLSWSNSRLQDSCFNLCTPLIAYFIQKRWISGHCASWPMNTSKVYILSFSSSCVCLFKYTTTSHPASKGSNSKRSFVANKRCRFDLFQH